MDGSQQLADPGVQLAPQSLAFRLDLVYGLAPAALVLPLRQVDQAPLQPE